MAKLNQRSVMRISCAAVVALLWSATAFAKEGDVEACAGLEAGDGCTRADGDPGVCQPDDSDPNVIKCDDDGLGSSGAGASGGDDSSDDGSIECAYGAGPGTPDAGLALALAGVLIAARRRHSAARSSS